MKKEKTSKHFHIKDLETLRAVSDPLRIQIVELLTNQNLTVKQVAEKLGLASSKLYYHFGALEKLGMIEVAETRMVSNMVEKVYQSNADQLDVDPSLLRFSKEGDNESFGILISSTIDATREDIIRSLQARQFQLDQGAAEQSRRFIINRVVSRISEERVAEFQKRLVQLIQEFESEDERASRKSNLQPYALTVALYPSFYFDKASKKEKKK
ncbi:MAG TPA: winged helix-turn-helix domain-containing protein [Anaerolineales bacterium]|nr:winged helix-turn-helix domain-containing protein [Anaerolineales bacterium]